MENKKYVETNSPQAAPVRQLKARQGTGLKMLILAGKLREAYLG